MSINKDGSIQGREIYDIFFTPRDNWPDMRLLCISPHDLISAGQLAVVPQGAPGKHLEDSIVYSKSTGCSAEYDATTGILAVVVPAVTERFLPIRTSYVGTVLVPEVRVPVSIAREENVRDVMIECGTLFEAAIGNVEAHKTYVIRLEIKPYAVIGMPDRIRLSSEPNPEWSQEAYIIGPKLCHFNFCKTLEETQQRVPEVAAGAAIIRTAIDNLGQPRELVSIQHHRILVISEPPILLNPRNPNGCAMPISSGSTDDGKVITEWAGGSKAFWMDDIECTADKVLLYLAEFAAVQPKSKESITAALGLSHDNCALIVDAMVRADAIQEVGPNQYRAVSLSEEQRKNIIQLIATNDSVLNDFIWRCFRIDYLMMYPYLSPEDAEKKARRECKERLVFQLALWGVILGALGVLIGILSFFY